MEDRAQEFKAWLSSRQVSPNTVETYTNRVRECCRWLGERTATKDSILGYLMDARARGVSPKTERLMIAAFRQWSKMLGQELVNGFEPRKIPRSLPQPLTHEEIRALLNHRTEHEGLSSIRARAMVAVMYYCGLRIGETVGLTLDAIDTNQRTLKVLGKGSKERIVPMADECWKLLQRYIAVRPMKDAPWLWQNSTGGPIQDRAGAYGRLRTWARKSGVRGFHPHRLRHSFGTEMLTNGADLRTVQELMGHASVATTQVYTEVSPALLHKKYDAFHPKV